MRLMRRKPGAGELDLSWIDGFVRSIRPHLFVREKDSLLILMPNQAYHLNETGIYLLKSTLAGRPIKRTINEAIPKPLQTPQALSEINEFFCDLRALVMGCLFEGHGRRGVERVSFQRGTNLLPVLSEIAVTYRCNLACRFCYAGCTCRSKADGEEMTTEQVKTLLRMIRQDAQVPSVSFTGGEPCVREDLPDLVRYASKVGLRVNLITNGTLVTDSLVRKLKAAGLRSAQVSVEGPDAQVHDMLTQVDGSFERCMRGVEALKRHGIYVHTNTTVNALNAEYIVGMVDLAISLGLPRLSMNMVMPCGTAGTGETSLRYREIGPLVQAVRKHARLRGIEFMWYSPTPYCLFNPIAGGLGSKACAACDGLLSVAPNGDVLPCSSRTDPVGNLLTSDFSAVWSSKRALFYRHREYAPDVCRSCESFELCSGACPIYWDAFGCEELGEKAEGVRV